MRSVRGDEIPVIANITGTLYAAEAHAREHVPAADLRDRPRLVPHHRLPGQRGHAARVRASAVQTGLAYFSSALSSELERALIQDIGVPIDLIEIRPGVSTSPTGRRHRSPSSPPGGRSARRRSSPSTPVSAPTSASSATRTSGASLEFRFSREWKLQSSVEPTIQSVQQFRRRPTGSAARSLYQIGLDILWEREF